MGVFHVIKIVQMLPNRTKNHILRFIIIQSFKAYGLTVTEKWAMLKAVEDFDTKTFEMLVWFSGLASKRKQIFHFQDSATMKIP